MRRSARKLLTCAVLAAGGGYLLAGPGTGCVPFAAETTLGATDFCFIFDCQNGIFGGTVDPCANTGTNPLTGLPRGPLFADCPTTVGP